MGWEHHGAEVSKDMNKSRPSRRCSTGQVRPKAGKGRGGVDCDSHLITRPPHPFTRHDGKDGTRHIDLVGYCLDVDRGARYDRRASILCMCALLRNMKLV